MLMTMGGGCTPFVRRASNSSWLCGSLGREGLQHGARPKLEKRRKAIKEGKKGNKGHEENEGRKEFKNERRKENNSKE
jgi:hypothetical protein